MIFLAFSCYSTDEKMRQMHREAFEMAVFVEANTVHAAITKIQTLLSIIWAVSIDSINVVNVYNESELIHRAFGEAEDGDMRLLECGCGSDGKPTYLSISETMLLLPRDSTDRLINAWKKVPTWL